MNSNNVLALRLAFECVLKLCHFAPTVELLPAMHLMSHPQANKSASFRRSLAGEHYTTVELKEKKDNVKKISKYYS